MAEKQLRRWKHRWGEDDFAASSVGEEFFTVEETEYRKLERELSASRAEAERLREALPLFEDLVENAPLDFMGTGSVESAKLEEAAWNERVLKVRAALAATRKEDSGA